MSELPSTPECPLTCPNRKGNGLTLFGWSIDPVELLLHCCIFLMFGIPSISKAATDDDFDVNQALKWMGAMIGCSTVIRLSPTDRVNAYLKILK